MMEMLVLALPAGCAAIAGAVVWTTNRREILSDASLIRQFLLWLAICMVLVLGLSRTHTVRLRIDPLYRLQTALDAHPVYAAVKLADSGSHAKLHSFLAAQMAGGKSVEAALQAARPLLEDFLKYPVKLVDHKTFLTWAMVQIETLKELQAKDPYLCFGALSPKPLATLPAAQSFSAGNTQAFHQSLLEIYAARQRDAASPRLRGEKGPEFNEVAREYALIMETVKQRFGESMEKQLSDSGLSLAPTEPLDKICEAKLFQLQAMQARQPEMASRLLRSSNAGLAR
jgi:hypothetical protein